MRLIAADEGHQSDPAPLPPVGDRRDVRPGRVRRALRTCVHAAAAPDHAGRGLRPGGGTGIIAREFAPLLAEGLGGQIEVIGPRPRLRLGYLVVPLVLASAFAWAKRLTARHSPGLEQDALADLIKGGAYERHVRRVRRRDGERRAALLAALSATLGNAGTLIGTDAGLHVVAWLNRVLRTQEKALIAQAHAPGLGVH